MKELTIIDLSSIFWQAWHATADMEIGAAYDATINKVYKYVNGDNPVAVAIDTPPYKRKALSEDYKAQRDKPSEAALEQLRRVIEHLKNDGFPVLGSEGYEADDIIATIVSEPKEDFAYHIITSDKDLLQLVDPSISVTSPLTGEIFDPNAVAAKFGVMPDQLNRVLALMGDKSDNVPGVPGIGPKTAAKIVNGDITEPIQAKLEQYAEQIKLSEMLIRLMNHAPIDIEECYRPREAKPIQDDEEMPEEVETEVITEPEPETRSTKLTKIEKRPSWALQLEPSDSDKAIKLAKILFDSRLYTKFANAQSILAVMLRGRALGMDATTALDGFHVIEGKPALSAPLMIGLVLRSPVCDYFKCIDTTDEQATFITHRSNDPESTPSKYTFTIKMADRMGLLKPSRSGKPTQWEKFPNTMLRWRCATELARMVYPDIVAGLYTPDEITDGQIIDAEAVS